MEGIIPVHFKLLIPAQYKKPLRNPGLDKVIFKLPAMSVHTFQMAIRTPLLYNFALLCWVQIRTFGRNSKALF
jgi:hypothetical protein